MLIQQKIEDFRLFVERNEPSSPDDAFKSSLQRTSGISFPYVVYRWVQFMLHFLIWLGAFLDYDRRWSPNYEAPRVLEKHGPMFYGKFFIYLTNWGTIMNMTQAFLGAIVLTTAYKNRMSPGRGSVVYGVSRQMADLYCNMFRIALVFAIYIPTGFWLLVWNPDSFAMDLVMSGVHGGGMVFMLVDLFVVQFAYTMKTGLYVFVIIVIFVFLTLVHYWTGSLDRYQDKTYIYDSQDWSKPWTTSLNSLGGILAVQVVNLVAWGFYQLRRHLFQIDNRHHGSH